jgi:hypothetical protein
MATKTLPTSESNPPWDAPNSESGYLAQWSEPQGRIAAGLPGERHGEVGREA